MPNYNRGQFIGDAIESILAQTHKKLELIIIDDASTDDSLEVIRSFEDSRIKLICNNENLGVSVARNRGIDVAKGNLIAFMDSDDISLACRLEKQLAIFSSNKNLVICGSWIKFLRSDKRLEFKEKHNEILTNLLLSCSLSIGTAMVKKSLFESEKLRPDLTYGEDYELWSRLCWMGEMYNVQEELLYYRSHQNQISVNNKRQQVLMDAEIRLVLFKKIAYSSLKFPDSLIKKFLLLNGYISITEFVKYLKWLQQIRRENASQNIFPQKEFVEVLESMRSSLILNVFHKKSNIGLNKNWRLKALLFLRKKEVQEIISKKVKRFLSI